MAYESESRQLVARAVLADVLVGLLGKLVAHVHNVGVSVLLVGCRAEEDGLWERDGDDVFESSHVEGAALEAMHKNEQVQATVRLLPLKLHLVSTSRGINLATKLWVLLQLKCVCDFTEPFVLDVALFKDQWGILLHPLFVLYLLTSVRVCLDLNFLCWHDLLTFDLCMKGYGISRLFRNYVIQLTSEIFTWKRKVLSKHNLSQDVFTICLLKFRLILVSKHFLNPLWLHQDQLVQK